MKNKYLKSKRCILGLFLFMFILFSGTAHAQRLVKGTVVDAETKETLPGVNVVVLGTTKGVATDLDGNFSISLDEKEIWLQFSYTGYEKVDIDVSNRNSLTVQLKQITTMMDEVVVIAYGSVRKSDLTGAVSSIKTADIGKVTSFNAEQSLQGKVSGVQITSTSGAPGAGSSVRIRGVGTFNNSSPIYVVDGVILDDISFLNAADIASMEILKDASSTAMYGSRGANGVILVQTKTGSASLDKPFVSVLMESSLQQLDRKIDLLDGKQFAIISNEISPGTYNNVDAVPNTDWQDEIFSVAPMHNYQVSVTGSSENSDYYLSVGLFQQEGIIDRSHIERLTVQLNNTYRITKKFKIGNTITISPSSQQVSPNVTFAAYRAQPVLEPYYADGSYGVVYNVGNPLASLKYSNNYNSGLRLVGNVYAEALIANAF
ncbi:MAG: SusC/RagA family TonB-linked outer membrane protein, partial [Bacteroidetes bacterium]|nr:SusC/RagA family TonB-linked outer membrane protein [Bacteroidota bacterium]